MIFRLSKEERIDGNKKERMAFLWAADVPEMLIRVVSILPPLVGMKLSMKVGPPVRRILDKLTFTNSRLMLRESFLPVTEEGSSSTVP